MKKVYSMLLKQGAGPPCIPVVSTGDIVKRGHLIAQPDGLGANLHASVGGTVMAVTDQSIILEASEWQNDDFEPVMAAKDSSIADMVKAAGVVGMGGAGFPTWIKLNTQLEGGTVIANAVECEPLLKHNIKQLIKNPQLVYQGMLYAMKSVHAKRGILAIKNKNREAARAFSAQVQSGDSIKIAFLPDQYPMGEERAIIRETLGVLLKPDQLPSDADAVVLNVETLSRIAEAVKFKRPAISKNVTIAGKFGSGMKEQVLFDVPLGTPIRQLIEHCGGIEGNYGEIIMGGPFMGKSVELDDVITKTSGGMLITMEFMRESRAMGLLVCACGAGEARLREIAGHMGAPVVGVEHCKQAIEGRGSLKCEDPGNCPGQAEKIMSLRNKGARVLLVSNCSDCTNTVMCVAPKLKLPVYHCTDHVMRTVNHPLIRRLK